MKAQHQVMWSGAVMDPSGYGEASRGYVTSLYGAGLFNLQIKPKYFWKGETPDFGRELEQLVAMGEDNVDPRRPYLFVQHLTPENWRLGPGKCIYHVGMTTFETDSLPQHWQMNMRAMDELWTFSQWGADVFRNCGINRPITVIPHGVDVERFNPEGPRLLTEKPAAFVFGANFEWSERKNPEALLRAYYTAFKPDDDVMLLIKSYYQHPIEKSRQYIHASMHKVRQEMGLQRTPRVGLITDTLSADQLAAFYRSLDCYVLPSRGEGWGLTYSEAMASGLPTIAVGWSGHTEFMNATNSILLKDYKLVDVTKQDRLRPQYFGQRWADPNVEELTSVMLTVAENPIVAKALGEQARRDMVERFSWPKVTQVMISRINEIFGRADQLPSPPSMMGLVQ